MCIRDRYMGKKKYIANLDKLLAKLPPEDKKEKLLWDGAYQKYYRKLETICYTGIEAGKFYSITKSDNAERTLKLLLIATEGYNNILKYSYQEDVFDKLQQAHAIYVKASEVSHQLFFCSGPPLLYACLLYTSPSPRDLSTSRMPSSA
eukprot:TRINITY_DN16215_c0_g1_i1.p4 TRINITY_DN16215_c0_g1~~TRINITY_DN16215_c0_g1_i1.p4  ORF type:complete len:148 (-),score=32.98 TRINITY_DN16215_c0_g1_i1:81-524(-)